MPRLCKVLVLVLVGCVVGWLAHEVVAGADSPAKGPGASGNGDTNGDGKMDIADVVYLLGYLFGKGDPPAPLADRFVDHGDGTVTDNSTGLMWCQATCDVNGDGSVTEEDAIQRGDADAAVAALRVGGYADWRMPTTKELYSIVAFARTNPAIDPVFEVRPGDYWIASTNAGDPCHGSPFSLEFMWGFLSVKGTSYDSSCCSYIRAVRGEQL